MEISLSDFFSPLSAEEIISKEKYIPGQLGASIESYVNHFPIPGNFDLAIIGVQDDRNTTDNEGCALAPDYVREKLYTLYAGSFTPRIADLGNIRAGANSRDTYAALKTAVKELLEAKIVPLIIGGGQDLTYAQYLAYEKFGRTVDLVQVDAYFDLEISEDILGINSSNYLNEIILHDPSFLFNFSNIGYQTYFASQEVIRMMDKMFFDAYRLGEVRGNIQEIEPVVRNADMMSFDMTAIRMSDAPGNAAAVPNGLFAEEACQLCYYAGMSDKISSIGFYEFNPLRDTNSQTASLLAQMLWCFIDGFYNRKKDLPLSKEGEFIKYRATFKNGDAEVLFYKSKKTDRWWMQVPYPQLPKKNERHHLVPCTYKDYQLASSGEMPDRWWKTLQKLL